MNTTRLRDGSEDDDVDDAEDIRLFREGSDSEEEKWALLVLLFPKCGEEEGASLLAISFLGEEEGASLLAISFLGEEEGPLYGLFSTRRYDPSSRTTDLVFFCFSSIFE